MNKLDLAKKLATDMNCSQRLAREYIDAIFNILKSTLSKKKEIVIIGFGSFLIKERKGRDGVNPQTREAIKIAAKKVIVFRPSQALKDGVNKK